MSKLRATTLIVIAKAKLSKSLPEFYKNSTDQRASFIFEANILGEIPSNSFASGSAPSGAEDKIIRFVKLRRLERRNLLRHVKKAARDLGLPKTLDFRSFRTMHL